MQAGDEVQQLLQSALQSHRRDSLWNLLPTSLTSLMSCINVALDFVSPENLGECFRLTEEFRVLPHGHEAKEDKLESCIKVALEFVSPENIG